MDDIKEYKYPKWCWSCEKYATIWNQRLITTIHDCILNHGIVNGKCEMVFGDNKPSMYMKR